MLDFLKKPISPTKAILILLAVFAVATIIIMIAAKSVEKPPVSEEKIRELENLIIRERDYEAALKEAQALIKDNPSNIEIWHWEGVAEFQLGKVNEAKQSFEQVLALDPEHKAAQNYLEILSSGSKFIGNVVAVEGDTITLHGVFSGPGTVPEDLLSARDFSFRVDETTRFEKTEIRWPTWEEIAAQGTSSSFDIQDLPRTEGEGNLDDFKNSFSLNPETIYVEVDFSSSIYNSENPTASSVFYQVSVIPPHDLSPQNP